MIQLTRDDLARFCARPKRGQTAQTNWDGYVSAMTSPDGYKMFQQYGVITRAELCAFLANAAEETGDSGGFTCLWENLNFTTVGAIRGAWSGRASRYSDSWIKSNLCCNPQALGDWAYGGRMGNGVNNGDGYKYRGFGILQTTGKTDHLRYLNGDYSYLSALRAALMEWHDKGCGEHVQNGDFRTACILINGGTNGLSTRQQYFASAQRIWTADPNWTSQTAVASDDQDTDPNDNDLSLTVPPFIANQGALPQIVTAADLAPVSRKVSMLIQAKNWLAGLGIGGGGLGLADFQNNIGPFQQISHIIKDNAPIVIALLCVAGFVAASVLITYIVEDYNSQRYQPSKGS